MCDFQVDNGNGIRFHCINDHDDNRHVMRRDYIIPDADNPRAQYGLAFMFLALMLTTTGLAILGFAIALGITT